LRRQVPVVSTPGLIWVSWGVVAAFACAIPGGSAGTIRIRERELSWPSVARREKVGCAGTVARWTNIGASPILYPEYRRRRREIELETRQFIARYAAEGLRTGVVRIPVVVHVVWNTAAQNISNAQIQSQIDVLNADFRRTNSDAGSVPSYFAGVAADTRIEFALAVHDPNCAPTTGITRQNTTATSFSQSSNGIKSAAAGGMDPWPVDRYLNIWVAPRITSPIGDLLGYGQFPGGPAATDGVVILHSAFGTQGTVVAPFDLGRTATHEVGHWLNLNHIWGDDTSQPNQCLQSDQCADTPNQADETFGNPTGIRISCSNGPNGDMYMNYMDYTDDVGMFMFTEDQATRMNATLSVARSGLLASDGLIPVTGGAPTPDLRGLPRGTREYWRCVYAESVFVLKLSPEETEELLQSAAETVDGPRVGRGRVDPDSGDGLVLELTGFGTREGRPILLGRCMARDQLASPAAAKLFNVYRRIVRMEPALGVDKDACQMPTYGVEIAPGVRAWFAP